MSVKICISNRSLIITVIRSARCARIVVNVIARARVIGVAVRRSTAMPPRSFIGFCGMRASVVPVVGDFDVIARYITLLPEIINFDASCRARGDAASRLSKALRRAWHARRRARVATSAGGKASSAAEALSPDLVRRGVNVLSVSVACNRSSNIAQTLRDNVG